VLEHADMPEWMTVKNMTMFCEEVIPRVRAKGVLASASAGADRATASVGD